MDLPNVRVSSRQFGFYQDLFEDKEPHQFLRRMTREFNLGVTACYQLVEDFPDSFTVVSSKDAPVLPSHEEDDRSPFYIREEIHAWLYRTIKNELDQSPYEAFDELNQFFAQEQFQRRAEREWPDYGWEMFPWEQYPLGVHAMNQEILENPEILKTSMDKNVDHEVYQTARSLLRIADQCENPKEKTAIYLNVANLLYDQAIDLMEEEGD